MDAKLKELQDERNYLLGLAYKTMNQNLPFTIQIDGSQFPDSITEKARFGITNYVTMRLRKLEELITEIKKGNK